MIRFALVALALCTLCRADNPLLAPKRTPQWDALWSIPTATTSAPLVIRKSLKGRSTEANAVGPLNAVIYQPIEISGRYWARHWFTAQPAGGSTPCGARIVRSTYSELFPSSSQAPPNTGSGQVVNRDSGAQAYAATVEIPANSGTNRTEAGGGWGAFSSGGQTPVTRFSATSGASVTYTITGVTRIHFRAFCNSANGGRLSVAITNAGVQIPEASYLVGPDSGTRTFSLAYISSAYNDTRFAHVPLAKGLVATNTYTVTLTLSSGTRIYDAGLLGYLDADDRDGYAFDAVGVHGLWDNYTSFGNNKYQGCLYAGSRVVYVVTNATRIDWRYGTRSNAGRAAFRIYDASGNEMSAFYNAALPTDGGGHRYVETFNAATAEASATLATGLPVGVYYLHVWSLPSRGNSFTETTAGSIFSSAWAIFDGGPLTYNAAIGGTVGVDTFADTDRQFLGGNTDPLDGAGNYVFAGQVRDTGDANLSALYDVGYVTGTHGAETYATNYTVSVDGVALSWDAAADQTQWTGSSITIQFETLIGTQASATNYWATATYRYVIDRTGIVQAFRLQTTRNIHRGTWYTGMLIAGNDAVSFTAANASLSVTPTPGAVYLANGVTNTVISVIVGGSSTVIVCEADAVPTTSTGTITKLSGTGDASITYTSSSAPLHIGQGFKWLYFEPALEEVVDVSVSGTAAAYNRPHRGAAFWTNEGHCLALEQITPGTIWSEWDGASNASYYFERSRTAKTYAIVANDSTGQTTGSLLSSGYDRTWVSKLRIFLDARVPTILGP